MKRPTNGARRDTRYDNMKSTGTTKVKYNPSLILSGEI